MIVQQIARQSGSGYSDRVVNRYCGNGFSIHEGDFSWGPRAEMSSTYEGVELHYRVSPGQVQARISSGGSDECPMGRLLLIPPLSMRARAANKAEDVRTVLCRFDRDWLEDFVGTRLDWEPERLPAYANIADVDIETMMRRVSEEISQTERLAADTMIDGLGQCLAVDVARRFSATRNKNEGRESILLFQRLGRIQEMVREAHDRIPSATEIAAECRLSPTYLRRIFREGTGQTLHGFLEEARVTMACRLLRETDLSLKIISYRVGFSHHSAFSYAFRQRLGMTPKDYRARFG
jgi:AraC family transcriptional regulator